MGLEQLANGWELELLYICKRKQCVAVKVLQDSYLICENTI